MQFLLSYFLVLSGLRKNDISDYQESSIRIIDNKISPPTPPIISNVIPKIIWSYWDATEKPSYVKIIMAKVQEFNPDHEVRLLDPITIKNFLSDELDITGEMPAANKSDIIRLLLLKKFGGIWIDSTILVYESFSWVHDLKGYDLIAFYRDRSTIDYNFPVIESWFLCASENNRFITAWLEELLPLAHLGSKNYFKLISARNDYDVIRQNINSPEYLLVYLAQQIAMRRVNKVNLNLICCEDSAFYFQEQSGWRTISNALTFMLMPLPRRIPKLIKLTGMDRRFLTLSVKMKLIRHNSIFGVFLNKY